MSINKKTFLIFRLVLFLVVFTLFIPKKAWALLCSPTFPATVNRGATTQITFDLSSTSNPVSCLNNPDRRLCYRIVGCNSSSRGGANCTQPQHFLVLGENGNGSQVLSGNQLVGQIPVSGDFTFWLESWNPALALQDQFQLPCGSSTTWHIRSGVPQCDAAAIQVVGVRGGREVNDYTWEDELRIKFNGNYTRNFSLGGFFTGVITQNGSQVRVFNGPEGLGAFTSVVDGRDRLHYRSDLFTTSLLGDIDIGGTLAVGTYQFEIIDVIRAPGTPPYCEIPFEVSEDGNNEPPGGDVIPFEVCNQIPGALAGTETSAVLECRECRDQEGIWTAIGCVRTDSQSIVKKFLSVGLGIAGGIALLMIVAAGFLLSTSQGEPKRTQEARDLVTSSIMGLLFIVFSVVILQFIGVNILQIPGFAG